MTRVIEQRRANPAIDGITHMLPVASGIIPFATLIGVAIIESPIANPVGYLAGLVIAGGSAHLAVVGSVAVGAGVLTAVVTALLINARGLIYGAALAPAMREQPRWFRWVAAYGLVDQVFALVSSVLDRDDDYVRSYYLGAMGLMWTVYLGGVGAGMVLGPVIPESWPLGLAVPIVFVAMLAPSVKGRSSVASTAVGLTVAIAGSGLPSGLGLILAIVAGTAAGAIVDSTKGETP
jgi:predicted branched-subunit amino acid permease